MTGQLALGLVPVYSIKHSFSCCIYVFITDAATATVLITQKFASQNGRLKDKHRMMKKQLTITQKQINTLQLKLRLYQPNFTLEDEVEVTSV